MRNAYLVCYDITEPKRWRKVYQIMQGAGDPLQYSVFRCDLSPVERQLLQQKLWEVLDLSADRVMVVNLGPVGSRGDECVEFWGDPRTTVPDRTAVVV